MPKPRGHHVTVVRASKPRAGQAAASSPVVAPAEPAVAVAVVASGYGAQLPSAPPGCGGARAPRGALLLFAGVVLLGALLLSVPELPCGGGGGGGREWLAAPSGPLAEALDVSLAPLLWRGASAGLQSSAHEREGDMSSYLYAEGERLFFLDEAGPVCATRLYWAISPQPGLAIPAGADGGRAWDGSALDPLAAVLHVEVDGVRVFAGDARGLYSDAFPAFPRALVRAVAPRFAEAGVVLTVPMCAAQRLRLAWSFPVADGARASELLAHADSCIALSTPCFLRHYQDAAWLRPGGGSLPRGWAPFAGTERPALLPVPEAVGALDDPRAAEHDASASAAAVALAPFNAEALLARLAARADVALSHSACSDLTAASPVHEAFAAHGAGVLLALVIESPDGALASHALVHSAELQLEAFWDVAPGDWDGPGGRAGGGALVTDLASLFGPPAMGRDASRRSLLPSPQYAFGTLLNSTAYLTLPAPFWHSAAVSLRLEQGAPPLRVCTRALATRGGGGGGGGGGDGGGGGVGVSSGVSGVEGGGCLRDGAPYSSAEAGYLQGVVHDVFVLKRAANVLADVRGVVGKLVAVTDHVATRGGEFSLSFAEGDVKVYVDDAASPSHWFSGYEDAFGGSHIYVNAPARTREAHFAHQRVDTQRLVSMVDARGTGRTWTETLCPDLELWSTRVLLLDAVPFHWALRLELEGFPGDYASARAKGIALFYGRNARYAPPPAITDVVLPASEVSESKQAGPSHSYMVSGGSSGAGGSSGFVLYDLNSAIPGGGELPDAEGVCPTVSAQTAIIDAATCSGERLALRALAVAGGYTATFSVAVDPRAARVTLRRLVDVRYGVQRAELRVEGAHVAHLLSADRAFVHLDTHWREVDVLLPPALTRHKSRLHVELRVLGSDVASEERTYPSAHLGEAWTEARWVVVCWGE